MQRLTLTKEPSNTNFPLLKFPTFSWTHALSHLFVSQWVTISTFNYVELTWKLSGLPATNQCPNWVQRVEVSQNLAVVCFPVLHSLPTFDNRIWWRRLLPSVVQWVWDMTGTIVQGLLLSVSVSNPTILIFPGQSWNKSLGKKRGIDGHQESTISWRVFRKYPPFTSRPSVIRRCTCFFSS